MKRGILYIMIGVIMNSLNPEHDILNKKRVENIGLCQEIVTFSIRKHHYLDGNCNLVRDWINCDGPQEFIALHFPFEPLEF